MRLEDELAMTQGGTVSNVQNYSAQNIMNMSSKDYCLATLTDVILAEQRCGALNEMWNKYERNANQIIAENNEISERNRALAKPVKPEPVDDYGGALTFIAIFITLIIVLIASIVMKVDGIGTFGGCFTINLIIGAVVLAIFYFCIRKIKEDGAKEKTKKNYALYEENAHIEKDNKAEIDKIRYNQNKLNELRENTEQLRNELYWRTPLHSKYYNLHAVMKIYEYLTTGRCDTLYGHGGAYDTYEVEVRQDKIIQKLDNIGNMLYGFLMQNRYMQNCLSNLSASVEEQSKALQSLSNGINRGFSEIGSRIDKTNEWLEINNVHQEQIKRNTEYLEFAARQQRKNDGFWY